MSIMPWGLLWYDDTAEPLEEKVQRAARRYAEKYDRQPNTCFVHPEWRLAKAITVANGKHEYKVIASPTVLRHHFWIGEVA